MKLVTLLAKVDEAACSGCHTCMKVCPTLAISKSRHSVKIDPERCVACGNCGQRCETQCITYIKLEQPRLLEVTVDDLPREEVDALCSRAGFHPSQIVCYCTATRAEEVAAAILKGAHTPEEITNRTGLRSGCSVECIQPALRLLEAQNLRPLRPKGGWQWYGRTPVLSEIPAEVKAKYANLGFCFEEDEKLLQSVVASERR